MGWETYRNDLGVEYNQTVKILGIHFRSTMEQTMNGNWTLQTPRIKTNAKQARIRELCLAQRIRYIHSILLATIWFNAQILPTPVKYTKQITTAILWFIWKQAIFRVPTATLQKLQHQGGWALHDVACKCRALLLKRVWIQSKKEQMMTAALLSKWGIVDHPANPPTAGRIPKTMAYLIYYALDMAYIETPTLMETNKLFTRRLYSTIYEMDRAGNVTQEMRIVRSSPTVNWNRVWRNLHSSWVSEDRISTWYAYMILYQQKNDYSLYTW